MTCVEVNYLLSVVNKKLTPNRLRSLKCSAITVSESLSAGPKST